MYTHPVGSDCAYILLFVWLPEGKNLPAIALLSIVSCRGNAYQQAVMLAYKEAPDLVAVVEGAWASWLKAQGRHGQAIQHYTAAGQLEAAVEAAGAARNWEAASGILKTMVSV